MIFQRLNALYSAILYVTFFVGIKFRPFSVRELEEEVKNKERVNKVNESVADICLILKVNGQIKKVVVALVICVNFLEEGKLIIFIRNIFDHNCSP